MGGSFKNFTDMIDGGGAGATGPTFKGGLLSDALNAMGVRPYGYMDRLGSVRPQMRPTSMGSATRPQARPASPNYADRFAPQRAPLGEMEALDEGSMGRDTTSGTPSFRNRLQEFARTNAGDPVINEPIDLGATAYRPDPAMVANAFKEHPSAPGYGQAFLSAINQLPPNERDMVMNSEDAMYSLFQRFMQTGSIR